MSESFSLSISVRFAGKRAVVVGAGPVGRRRLDTLLQAGATVRVIALEPPPTDLSPAVEWVTEPYREAHLDGAELVVAAANSGVNARVVADANARRIWVCDTSDPARGDFSFPATGNLGPISIAVDTGGASPILARQLRDRIIEQLDPRIADWANFLAEIRQIVRETWHDGGSRHRFLAEITTWSWFERLQRDGLPATREAMIQALRKASTG